MMEAKVVPSRGARCCCGTAVSLLAGLTMAGQAKSGTQPYFGSWTRAASAPVIAPRKESVFRDPVTGVAVHWEALHTFNPAAVVRDGKVYLLYRAEDDSGSAIIGGHTSRLGLAVSSDGVHFTREPEPVFYPAKDSQMDRETPGGVEDPRIVESPAGGYVLTYTQWSRKRGIYSVGIATSPDLRHWQKHGPAFADASGRYAEYKYKSAAVVTELRDGRPVAARIGGKFWMYWGDSGIRLASSGDLIHWTPLEDASGEPRVILKVRAGLPDSDFPEAGPPPLLTANGIVMLYNAKNKDGDGADPRLKAGTYSVEVAVFAPDDPAVLRSRTDDPVFKPELPFEQTGQYAAGTTFAEGLVLFKGKWWMYYGCADSFVGVAARPARYLVEGGSGGGT